MKKRSLCYRCGSVWVDLYTDEPLKKDTEYISEAEYMAMTDEEREAWDNGEIMPDDEEDDMLPDPPAEIVIPDSVTICQAIAFDSMI